jgi:hypothetical protein
VLLLLRHLVGSSVRQLSCSCVKSTVELRLPSTKQYSAAQHTSQQSTMHQLARVCLG